MKLWNRRMEPAFQPPAEVLERKDSLGSGTEPKSAVVKTVNATLTALTAFGALAPTVTTIADIAPTSFDDVIERGPKSNR
jgi:hypothetical protein